MRVLRDSTATVTTPILDATGGVPTSLPSEAYLTVTGDDSVVVASQAVPIINGEASFLLTAALTDELDRLKFSWVTTDVGTTVTYVDIVGGFLFTVAEARAALGNDSYDAQKIAAARTYAETEIESALGCALVPRYARTRASGAGRREIRASPYLRAVRWVQTDGVAMTPTDLALLRFDDVGFIYSDGYWPTGYSNLTIGYEHGLDTPPPGAGRAALNEAVAYLGGGAASSIDPRVERLVTDDGTMVFGAASSGSLLSSVASEWVAANRLVAIA